MATGASVSTPEDTPRTIALTASDPDGDAITRAIAQGPGRGTLGTISGGNVLYTPTAQLNGADSLQFTASDGAATSPAATVSITVTEVNDAPDAVNDTTSVTEDGNVLVNVRSNDTKGPANESGQTLAVSSVTTPLHGTAAIEAGSVRYTPAGNYSGSDSFGYEICDDGTTNGSPAVLCDSATVSVTVTPVNDPPAAVDDAASTSIGVPVTIDVLANDLRGPTDEAAQTLTIANLGTPAHGSSAIVGGKVRYSPAPGYLGPDTFGYEACDDGGLCDAAQVSVGVVASSPPLATDVAATALEDVESAIDLAATDPDGDALSYSVVAPPVHGTVVGIAGRVLRYLPAANYHGDDSLTFRASDGPLQSNVATVSLTVHAVNDHPVAAGDVVRAATDAPVLVDVLGNDSPGPADELVQTLRLAGVGSPQHGSAVVAGGRILYTPSPTHNGPDTFTYSVCDDGRTGGLPDPRCTIGTVDFSFSALPLPVNRRAPRIAGGIRAGTVAVAELGDWAAVPVAVGYRWLRCSSRAGCVSIAGATGSRYRVRLADVGRALRVAVTVRNRFGDAAATSGPTAVVRSPVEIAAVGHRGREWVLLRNQTRASVPLRGWTLRDAGGAVHPLGRRTIRSLRELRVRTPPIWDARDRVTLRLPGGRVADTCAYAARVAVASC